MAANLLMFFVCALGLLAIFSLKKESMPAFTPEEIEISVPYPGAGPEEVELGIVIKIEEALNSIQGIKEIRSYSREGSGQVRVEVETGYELADMTDLIKLAVDSISTFPVIVRATRIANFIYGQRSFEHQSLPSDILILFE